MPFVFSKFVASLSDLADVLEHDTFYFLALLEDVMNAADIASSNDPYCFALLDPQPAAKLPDVVHELLSLEKDLVVALLSQSLKLRRQNCLANAVDHHV